MTGDEIRAAALAAAVRYHGDRIGQPYHATKDVLATASQFAAYIHSGNTGNTDTRPQVSVTK